jgi:PAS domain S-box-containing protein
MSVLRAIDSAGESDPHAWWGLPALDGIEPLEERYRLRYQELFEFASVALAVTDRRGVILEANHAVAALLRHSKEFLIGKPLGLLLEPGLRNRFYTCLVELAAEGRSSGVFESQLSARCGGKEVALRAFAVATPWKGSGSVRWQFEDISLRKHADRTRRDLLRRLVTLQENERRRISREIHDQLGQELTALNLGLKSLESEIPEGSAGRRRLRELQDSVDRLGRQTHDMAFDLRPAALDDLGLRAAIHELIRRWSLRVGIPADFHFGSTGNGRVSSDVESAVYRVVQEALTNVAKHSNATSVSVIVEHGDSHLMALVEDDGKGFDPELPESASRLGLLGMYERLSLVGGSLQVESSPGSGTTVRARVPCKHATEAAEP